MPNEDDLWTRLAREARQEAEPTFEADPALVAGVLERWRRLRPSAPMAIDIWQVLGFRVAMAAGLATLVILLLSGALIPEAFASGLSFLQEVGQVEVIP